MASCTDETNIKIMLLGEFDVRLADHTPADITYAKMRALLAYLAAEQEQDHSRNFLSAMLWPGSSPETARGNLRRTLSHLRRALEYPSGKALFSTSKHTIRFVPDLYIDALFLSDKSDASDEEEAIALYRGEFMAGFSLPDSPDFESWLQMQRETFRRRACTLLERLANRHEQNGDHGKALHFSLRHIELEPLLEAGHRRVMRLYALNGHISAAIAQFDQCCRLLETEFGISPGDETRLLAERIRNGKLGRRKNDDATTSLKRAPAGTPVDPTPLHLNVPAKPYIANHMEKRQATVLCVELACPAIEDIEEEVALLRSPRDRCEEIIQRLSGYLVQTHSNGLLAYFGYPKAREDAANCAIQAALAITRIAVSSMEIRAGVHTGLIITDNSLPDIIGKTPRLAILLCQSAAPGEIAISEETRNITGGHFEYDNWGKQLLPGHTLPVEIFRVVKESSARTRMVLATKLSPFVGRKPYLAKLMALWKEVIHGDRHVVLLRGEAGEGKSRLLHELKERLVGQPHAVRELRCFPEYSQSPLSPVIALLESIFGFTQNDTPESKSGKLIRYLQAHYPTSTKDSVPLLSQLLALPLNENYHACAFSPQKQKEQTITILLNLLQSLASQQPVLLIVEDLHWCDPSTLELLTLFIEKNANQFIFSILSARPEFDPPWNESLETMLELAPLNNEAVEQLITSIDVSLSAATIRNIVERADGVPLFVEEITKIANLNNHAAIPCTLRDLLIARLDNLGEVKRTAQLAACLGRSFDITLLGNASPYDAKALAHHLKILRDEGLVFQVSETISQFKHALIQETAYQSQTKDDREVAHNRIAQILQSNFPGAIVNHAELLAQHFASACEAQHSISHWIKTGQHAAGYSAHQEALEQLHSALQLLLKHLPSRDRDKEVTATVMFLLNMAQ